MFYIVQTKIKKNLKNLIKQINRFVCVCITWLLNMLNSQENSDGYLAYKSVIKQKLHSRTKELKMSLTIEEFFEYCFKRKKFHKYHCIN